MRNLQIMYTKTSNNKLIFVGDLKSVNLEIIAKSYKQLTKKNMKIILIGNAHEIKKYFERIKFKVKIIELFNIEDHQNFNSRNVFIFHIGSNSIDKPKMILNQIVISNNLSKHKSYDLITMPIDKSIIKKENNFNGVTEFLSQINYKKTFMLMRGENFSIIPLTTHIKFKNILNEFNAINFYKDLKDIIHIISKKGFDYNKMVILGINPHAGEDGTLGDEEVIIRKVIIQINKEIKFLKLMGPFSADSAFKNVDSKKLFISYYHDQALIPFKILNTQSINHTIGLSYNRFSPTHGTANDIIYKNKSNNSSFLKCMLN
jgi:4-hydroxythreonine-4-phosphate dehydrogenase